MGDLTKYLEGIDIIYYINLDRSVERRKNMEELLSHFNIPNVRISAVDGKKYIR
jgi:GR25 family glycosyltransferase involved in LPS biosynthesis